MAKFIFGSKDKDKDGPSSMDLLVEYSKQLGDSASGIKEAASSFKSSSEKLSGDLNENIEELINTIKGFSSDFKESVNRLDKDRETNDNKFIDAQEEYIRAYGENGERLISKGQKIGQALISSFSRVFSYGVKRLTTGFENVVDSYNSNLYDITVRLDQSHKEYTEMLNESTKWIKDNNLTKQFSEIDWSESLIDALSTGLRGETSEEVAYRNMITNKLLPMITTNTKSYTRMSKILGQSFSDMTDAIGSYTEKVYGAEGLEEGRLNSALEQSYRELLLAGEGNKALVDEIWGSFADKYNELANSYSPDYADYWLNTVMDYAQSNLDNTVALLSGEGLGISPGDMTGLLTHLDEFTDNLGNILDQLSGGSSYNATYMAQAGVGGLDLVAMEDRLLYNMYGSQSTGTGNVEENAGTSSWAFNKKNEQLDKLEEGQYQNKTDQQTKQLENATAKAANFIAEHIPDPLGVLNVISGTVSDILSTVKTLILTNAGGDILGGILGRGGGSSAAGNVIGKVLGAGTGKAMTLAEATGVGISSGSASLANFAHPIAGLKGAVGAKGAAVGAGSAAGAALNLLAGPGALAAGLFLAGQDAWKAGSKAIEDGGSAGQVAGAITRGAITGRQTRTSEDQLNALESALSGEKQKFDWKSFGKNTAKGAALGAGVGTIAGGWAAGAGTAIGAAVGAATGAVTNAIDQWASNSKYNQLADAINKSTEAFDNLSEAQKNYEDATNQSKTALDLLSDAQNQESSTREESFETLKKLYPEQFGSIKDINDLLSGDYLTSLKSVIAEQEREALVLKQSSLNEVLDSFDKIDKKFDKIVNKDDIKSSAALEAAKKISEAGGKKADTGEVNEILSKVAESYNIDRDELIKELNSGKSGEIFKVDKQGNAVTDKNGNVSFKKGTAGDNIKQFAKDYEKSREYEQQVISHIEERKDQLIKMYDEMVSDIFDKKDSQLDYEVRTENFRPFAEKFSQEVNDLIKYSAAGPDGKHDYSAFAPKESDFKDIKSRFNIIGVSNLIPEFEEGTYRIGSDELLARLHNNEMVLNSKDAENLRSLVEDSRKKEVSSYLEKSKEVHEVSNDSNDIKNLLSKLSEKYYNEDSLERSPVVSQTSSTVDQVSSINLFSENLTKTLRDIVENTTTMTSSETELSAEDVVSAFKNSSEEVFKSILSESLGIVKSSAKQEDPSTTSDKFAQTVQEFSQSSSDKSLPVNSRNANEEEVETYEPVVNAIKSQTDTLSGILEVIHEEISKYFKKVTEDNGNFMSQRLVSFRGV